MEVQPFTTLYLDVSIPALRAHKRFGLKLRPAQHELVFDALDKMMSSLDLASEGSSECQREFLLIRDQAVADFKEWQELVDEWKGGLLTRLSELGNELDELRGRERCLRQQSAQKDTFIAELRQEQRHLQKDLRRARATEELRGHAANGAPGPGITGVAAFLTKLRRRDSKESLGLENEEARFSLAGTVKAGLSAMPFVRKSNSQVHVVKGVIPTDSLPGTASDEEQEEQILSNPAYADVSDAAVQADFESGSATCHVGTQCYLPDNDFPLACARMIRRQSMPILK
mmetsp:Transcript_133059/g.315383  ORF Transcript_133059/g.315383 Transcript_133059/m.315383 type:complete len:286 (+) Transcript_133059:66-923(+)